MPTFEVEVRYTVSEIYILEAKDAEDADDLEKCVPDNFSYKIAGESDVWRVTEIDTPKEGK